MGIGHDDDHGFGGARGDEGIEDPMGFAVDGPGGFVVAVTVGEIQDGEFAEFFVAGRGVDDDTTPGVQGFGTVDVFVDDTVGDVLKVPWSGGMGGDVEDAGSGPALWFHGRIEGIDHRQAIDHEMVLMNTGFDVGKGDRPESLGVLHEVGVGTELAGDGDLIGLGRPQPEGDAAIGEKLGGNDGTGTSGGGFWGRVGGAGLLGGEREAGGGEDERAQRGDTGSFRGGHTLKWRNSCAGYGRRTSGFQRSMGSGGGRGWTRPGIAP